MQDINTRYLSTHHTVQHPYSPLYSLSKVTMPPFSATLCYIMMHASYLNMSAPTVTHTNLSTSSSTSMLGLTCFPCLLFCLSHVTHKPIHGHNPAHYHHPKPIYAHPSSPTPLSAHQPTSFEHAIVLHAHMSQTLGLRRFYL